MDVLGFRKFTILLWKNFILKRRRLIALVVEVILTFIFGATLLATRHFMVIKKFGPYNYVARSINRVPLYISAPTTIPYPWELAYVPSKSTVVRDIVENVKQGLNSKMKVVGFSTEGDFEDYVKQKNNSKKVLAAIVFNHHFKNSDDPLPLKVDYYLRFSNYPKSSVVEEAFEKGNWQTSYLFPPVPSVGPRNYDSDGGSPGYISEGFLIVQHFLDVAIMRYHNSSATQLLFDNISIFVQRFPYPSYFHDFFFIFSGLFIPLVIVSIFSMNHLTLIQSIVSEKESRLKEYQLMIGLSNWMLWAAYFCTFLLLYSIIIIFICIIFFVKIEPASIIQHSDPAVVFVFLLFYAIATICFSFMVSTFFNKSNFAVAFGGLLFFAIYFPASGLPFYYTQMTFTQKLTACLSSNFAMALGVKFLLDSEGEQIGLSWSNLFSSTKLDDFFFGYLLGIFLFDAFLYCLVACYVEAVFPGDYGVPKPWNFFFLRSYWFGDPNEKRTETEQFYETTQSKYFEAEPTDLEIGIQIQHLHKAFQHRKTTKIAVKDLSLNLYKGQITVLLGHNGAGKSTTLSILSGLYPPTSGKAYIIGKDISKQMVQIRKSLGICPQQDLLFNYLTVAEHLHFYCVIKGVRGKIRPKEIDNMLSAFNLLEKRDALSKALSGGMKRKLSIIISLIGDSQVVILDEPTSGMDPASRRVTWDLLQQCKQDCAILLTTHHMDEADILGDRIAIMVKGSLKCCGSSIFLKKIYGVGYRIVLVKEPHCDVEEISRLIHYYTPTATLENNVGTELSFIVPKEYIYRFEALFTALEERQEELGIASFGASVTTMEEVFLKVGKMEDSITDTESMQPPIQMSKVSVRNQNINVSSNVDKADSPPQNESPSVRFNAGCSLYNQQFYAMFLKRVMFSWRNWKLVLLQILGLLGSSALLLSSRDFAHEDPIRTMDLSEYGQTIVPVSVSGHSSLPMYLFKQLESILKFKNQRIKDVKGDLLSYLRKNEDCIHVCIIALSIEEKENETILTFLFNNEAYHSPSLSLSVLDNVLFRLLAGKEASFTVSNKPQPIPDESEDNEEIMNGHDVALNLQFGMALLVSGFCLLTVTERTTKAKNIQFLSGVSVFAYWLSALLWDFIIFFISFFLLMVMLKYYKFDIYVMNYHFLETMVIFTLYAWSAIPFVYLMSFLFSKSTSAFIQLLLLNYFAGTVGYLMSIALENSKCKDVIRLPLPQKAADIVSKELSGQSEDKDVQNERERILELQPQELPNSTMLIKELIKIYFTYPVILAVKNISLAIQKGECFGLLGYNGAGKTTTFHILTGETSATSGEVFIDGFNITKNIVKVRPRIGYCPQFDALLEYMTAREIMIMYARVWGISERQIKPYVKKCLNSLELESHADKLISTYSGGNKRRLSTAIALMGKPSIIFLDEPSTGMDPAARRLLWNTVTQARESGKAIIITSHSMEECDALCTRLAIMVQGKFMCLGSPQHLKNKFGNIYILKAKVKTEDKLEDFKTFITTIFPGSVLKHENQGILNYYIPRKDNSWGKVFGILEKAKEQFDLEDYSISQITLEQVFLAFAYADETAEGYEKQEP
ncbi:PREDICTED: ATP-binding cassette sub-family A member 3-like [Propithecus coquereli]|uniref:ATP-binding cassette sub-family A member 3-like n=1 Tax=Propithecus coquereli TaxID=379532 RepID=UPI00063F25E1|nr:PREDICTED: ATP-binding cassette sub-family A member 3-like [Propithecus coquereli]